MAEGTHMHEAARSWQLAVDWRGGPCFAHASSHTTREASPKM